MHARLAAVVTVLLILTGSAPAQEYTGNGITVISPWARATPGGVKVGGAYLELRAAPGKGDRLIAAKSPAAGSVEIHTHALEGGVARMRRVDAIEIAGGKSVMLQPGGYHIMLIDLKQPLREGDRLKLILVFETAGEIEVDATVEAIGAMGPRASKQHPAGSKHKH